MRVWPVFDFRLDMPHKVLESEFGTPREAAGAGLIQSLEGVAHE